MKKISLLMILALGTFTLFIACKNDAKNTEKETKATMDENAVKGEQPSGAFIVSPNDTKINWEASKVSGKHNGTIEISEGKLNMTDGRVTGGEFIIDMNTIVVLDQEGEWKDKLEAHLKGTAEGKEDHFFNVPQHPYASFSISKVGNVEGDSKFDTMVYGSLSIKGITKPVSFMAAVRQDGERVKVRTSEIVLDRTQWGVNYNSKSIFPNLKDNIIDDEFKLSISLLASKIRN